MGGWYPERLATVTQILEVDEIDVVIPMLLVMHERASRPSNG